MEPSNLLPAFTDSILKIVGGFAGASLIYMIINTIINHNKSKNIKKICEDIKFIRERLK